MSAWILVGLVFLLSYLLGAVPFGLLIARAQGVDIRQHGSGNIGATNVGRILGKKWGMICFVLDFGKGAVPVLIARLLGEPAEVLPGTLPVVAGVAAFVGHIFPVYLGFRGGKGVATGAGVVAVLLPLTVAVALVVWVVAVCSTRFVALASLLAAAVLPLWQFLVLDDPFDRANTVRTVFCVVASILVFVRHQSNIRQLFQGTEPRIQESTGMFQTSKILHVLAMGLWFGSAIFFTLMGLVLFDTFEELSLKAPEDRPLWYPTPEEMLKPPPSPKFHDPLVKEQGSRTAGYAVSPLFPWYYGIQLACAVIGLITAGGWAYLRPKRVHKIRAFILLGGCVAVGLGWWLERKVSDLRVPRQELTDRVIQSDNPSPESIRAAEDARAAFGRWHGYSLLVNLIALVLVATAMTLTVQLPRTASPLGFDPDDKDPDEEEEGTIPLTSGAN